MSQKAFQNAPSPRSSGPLRLVIGIAAIATVFGGLASFSACDPDEREARAVAQRVTSRDQLIGGPTALGEIGDWLIENDQIRLIVQDKGFNRGAGLHGGSLIDIDLVRTNSEGNPIGGNGMDTFGELFPAFFLEVIEPENISIINDGSDGQAAIVEVTGRGGEFATMLRLFNHAMVNAYEVALPDFLSANPPNSDSAPLVQFTARYILEPGARHVRIENSLTNISFATQSFPSALVPQLGGVLGVDFSTFRVPTGTVLGLGATNSLFMPGLGYDMRFALEDVYQVPVELPAFPGHVTDLVATSNARGISYGFATAPAPESNFIHQFNDAYGGQTNPYDMLFLFYASGFGGVFTHQIPSKLAPSYCDAEVTAENRCDELFSECEEAGTCPGTKANCISGYPSCLTNRDEHPSTFTFTNYFIVGSGDVASVRDEFNRIHDFETQLVQGRMHDEATGSPVGANVSLLIYDAIPGESDPARACSEAGAVKPRIFSQAFTNSAGYVEFSSRPGDFCYRARSAGRPLAPLEHFRVGNAPVTIRPVALSGGLIRATVVDTTGSPLPAKMTVVGSYPYNPADPDRATREFLFDLRAGEHWRTQQLVEHAPGDPSPRQYIEDVAFAGADGKVELKVRPGNYTVYFSRGSEYELDSREVTVTPGGVANVNGQVRRVVMTEGYLSGDFHTHAQGSIDSGLDYNLRVISMAAEGVDVIVSTEHNYISDFEPYVHRNQLQPWLKSVVGLELTTFEAGHFNVFPLQRDNTSANRGSIAWQDEPPANIFRAIRDIGSLSPEQTIIQVNHPRDSILGYFSQHNIDPFDTTAPAPKGGVDNLGNPSGPAFVETYLTENGRTAYRTTFSWDFDAIEIFNGKRFEMMRHYRMPYEPEDLPEWIREQLTDEEFAALPPKGTIMCDDNDVAFPGVLDDWYNMLNYNRPDGTYRKYTATGNSDSHHAGKPGDPEPGYPRNYFFVGHNDPQKMTDLQLVEALQGHHNIITNGPFINMSINDQPVGSTLATSEDLVAVTITAHAASWVGADRYTLFANGEVVRAGDITLDEKGFWQDTLAVEIERDTWFVLEVQGDNNLFPVLAPQEIPQIAFDAAIGSLAGPLGFGGGIEGLAPNETFVTRPFAFTNPIWVVHSPTNGSGGEFEPLNPPASKCNRGQFQPGELMSWEGLDATRDLGGRRLDAANVPFEIHGHHHDSIISRPTGEVRDLRMIFEAWGHNH